MLNIDNLRCEYSIAPLGINTPTPRLSWVLQGDKRNQTQSAYRICAATSRDALSRRNFNLWDTGKVISADQMVTYAGKSLNSGDQVWWQVIVWDGDDQRYFSTTPSCFELGLLSQEDWVAEWTGFPPGGNGQALYFRKSFAVDRKFKSARVYICGLGCYELHLNGNIIGDHVMPPGWSTYAKTVYYNVYDITQFLVNGTNMVGAVVGNGWYGAPSLLLQILISDLEGNKMVVCASGPGWQVTHGPLMTNSIYDGEIYDARLEQPGWDTAIKPIKNVGLWSGSMHVSGPSGRLVSEIAPPVRITEKISPIAVSEPTPQVYVFDMGQNFAGWVRLKIKGQKGEHITLKYAESLYPDGTVNQENLRSAKATDIYILKGDGVEQWEPRFTYHGFRYVQIEGMQTEPSLDTLLGCVMRSDNEPSGSFTCSSDLFNAIHKMVWWTEVSNEPSIPTDCPQRDERMGWLNDMAARSEQIVYNFNVALFLSKWVSDIADTQDPITGAITDTAPFRWGHRPADPVSVCYLLIPWLLYLHYGDKQTMLKHYNGMKAWVNFLHQQSADGILHYSYWGDWSPPVAFGGGGSIGNSAVSQDTPGELMSTGMSYYATYLLSKMADVVGNKPDAAYYQTCATRIAEAYHRKFYDPQTGGYGSNNQACNAFSLYLNIVPESNQAKVLDNLVHNVVKKTDGHLTTGNLCTKYLLEALSEKGRSDIAYLIASQKTYPSWGFMLENGATTLWERWEQATGGGMNSHNHPMMGSIGSWFYKYITGIQAKASGPGFRHICIEPRFIEQLDYAHAELSTIYGTVQVSWKRDGQLIELSIDIPVGSTAFVIIQKMGKIYTIEENGVEVWGPNATAVRGITSVASHKDAVNLSIKSGTYLLVCHFVGN